MIPNTNLYWIYILFSSGKRGISYCEVPQTSLMGRMRYTETVCSMEGMESIDLNSFINFSINYFNYLQRRKFLLTLHLRLPANCLSPTCSEWTVAPRFLTETSLLLSNIYHKWRVSSYFKMCVFPL